MTDFNAARVHMVESQLRPAGVTDERVLSAMAAVPRERFVPETLQGVAYIDEDLPLGGGRHLMEPAVFARLLQAAAIKPTDVVLDIGPASGYSTAVLARLAAAVVAVESDAKLRDQATALLADLGIDNAALIDGRLGDGDPEQAPFDVIVLSGAVDQLPPALCDQLADGGRLVAVIGKAPLGRSTLIERDGDVLARRRLFDAAVPSLPGFQVERGFVF